MVTTPQDRARSCAPRCRHWRRSYEWSGTGLVGNITRMLAALPLGAVIAFVLVDVAPGRQA